MKELANYGLPAKFCLLPDYVNKVLMKHDHTHLFMLSECSHATMAELSGCN